MSDRETLVTFAQSPMPRRVYRLSLIAEHITATRAYAERVRNRMYRDDPLAISAALNLADWMGE